MLVAGCGMVDHGGIGGGLSGAVPDAYRAFVSRAGSICPQIPPAIIAAQIEAESSWNPKAQSHDAQGNPIADGISQFIPGTWAVYGADGNGDGKADVWDPADAILTQGVYDCAIAKRLLPEVAGGNVKGDIVSVTLAAYNAGEQAVLNSHGIPPYPETQGYVARILSLAKKYQGAEEIPGGDSSAGAKIVEVARRQIGTPYVWGGGGTAGPTGGGFDCSGLTQYSVYVATGKVIPRTSQTQRTAGKSVPRNAMQPGDVIVFNNDGGWGHVGIYAGNGQMIDAPRPGKTVEVTSLSPYWTQFDWDVRRFT
ncbi:bifunctional lytic transglycosylase/C40 family peptidase [Streptomyces sp. LP11]|uniref:Bifunctional lytic transglycosylase/C40 family peptidase n=1 Tax=Streptomyces pyxinicus TaxID=2970331 RepID=A0ABT2B6N2_9ACTN|nr:bifunctional lytic transglycosylase/C40 family peptidase [Streptomyces sp. LP11]MCS0604180.1 bifunctional lytic transglycosylase/C40 family peptidase [Streptomyces sp. LP11]